MSDKGKIKPTRMALDDGRYWDRSDLEKFHLQQYLAQQEAVGQSPVIRLVMRDGKTVGGSFVEMGMYAYVIDTKVGEQVRRVMVQKHAINYVVLGEVGAMEGSTE